MLLHIGNDIMVPISDIIFILNINTCEKNKENKMIFSKEGTADQIIKIDKHSKSLVMTKSQGKHILYYSPISSVTLLKRSKKKFSDYTLA